MVLLKRDTPHVPTNTLIRLQVPSATFARNEIVIEIGTVIEIAEERKKKTRIGGTEVGQGTETGIERVSATTWETKHRTRNKEKIETIQKTMAETRVEIKIEVKIKIEIAIGIKRVVTEAGLL